MSDLSRIPFLPEPQDGQVRARGGPNGGVDVFFEGAWRRVYRTKRVADGVHVMRFLSADFVVACCAAKRHMLEVVQ